VAQQVTASSQTPGVFPGQIEANPKAHVWSKLNYGAKYKIQGLQKVKKYDVWSKFLKHLHTLPHMWIRPSYRYTTYM